LLLLSNKKLVGKTVSADGVRPSAGMTVTVGKLVKGIVSLVVLASMWFFLAPSQLGGSSSYVITYGTSMQPHYHAGDLAVVRSGGTYHVGDIVAYRNAQLGGHIVLHRIIGIANGHYTFKGDNNNFVDSFHPVQSQLVGHMWVHIPAAGKFLGMLHGPRLFLIVGLLALLLIAMAAFSKNDRTRGRRRSASSAQPVAGGSSLGALGLVPVAALAALVAFAGLGALSFTQPTTAAATQSGLYTQSGKFSYDASAPGGKAIYGASSVATGQPIFLQLVKQANFHFAYKFESKAAHSLAGRVGLTASLSAPDGWKRTFPLVGARAFSGDHVTVTGALDFRQVKGLLDKVGALSNVTAGTYTLTLQPQVSVHGAVAGDKIAQSFSPKLGFLLDAYQLQLQAGTAAGASSASMLTQSSSGSGPVTVANTVSLLKFKLPVTDARRIAAIGGVAALLLLLAGLLQARSRRPRSLREGIEQQFGELIVPVTSTPRGLELPTVSIASMAGLVQIADQLARPILHLANDEADVYFVEDSGFVYTYEAQDAAVVALDPAVAASLSPEASPQP
jgi:signal peptidase I